MSSIKLAPNASGTGEFTIAAPNSNTNRTFNLPDSSGTIATAESTLSQFNASGSAPVYACRAWVNFNGTGTVAIRASGNVSSITDNGLGDYTVNFTTAMPDTNYAVVGGAYWLGSDVLVASLYETGLTARTVSAVRVRNTYVFSGITLYDGAFTSVSVFR